MGEAARKLLTVDEVADILRLSPKTVYDYARDQRIGGHSGGSGGVLRRSQG